MRVAAVVHCAVTQGPLPAMGGGMAHPAMTQASAMVSVGWLLTDTRGFTATGWACPACEQRIVAPMCSKKPGMRSSLRGNSHHNKCAFINGDGGSHQRYARTLAVLNDDSRVVDKNERTRGTLEQNAAGRSGQIADGDRVHKPRAKYDAGAYGISGQRKHGQFGGGAPEAPCPDGIVGIALFELHPHAGADLRNEIGAHLLARDRHARHRPARRQDRRHVRHNDLNAAHLQGVDVLQDRSAIFSVVLFCFIHEGTAETVDTKPLRVSVKFCLYSPRLIEWVTLF